MFNTYFAVHDFIDKTLKLRLVSFNLPDYFL